MRRPEVVEWVDVSAPDPRLLVALKSYRNVVPIPQHWSAKRDYLSAKRGLEKPPFQLPTYITDTGIATQRDAIKEKEADASLKQKTRERVQPKMGKIDIDYQKLHDAFFKFQVPDESMTSFGQMYYEGKEFETNLQNKRPGEVRSPLQPQSASDVCFKLIVASAFQQLSKELVEALSIPPLAPPPWLIAQQRFGPPPSYPSLQIPGLNAPIPKDAQWGFHPGGWGKPPVDEFQRPLYGDVFGLSQDEQQGGTGEEYEVPVEKEYWGQMEPDQEGESINPLLVSRRKIADGQTRVVMGFLQKKKSPKRRRKTKMRTWAKWTSIPRTQPACRLPQVWRRPQVTPQRHQLCQAAWRRPTSWTCASEETAQSLFNQNKDHLASCTRSFKNVKVQGAVASSALTARTTCRTCRLINPRCWAVENRGGARSAATTVWTWRWTRLSWKACPKVSFDKNTKLSSAAIKAAALPASPIKIEKTSRTLSPKKSPKSERERQVGRPAAAAETRAKSARSSNSRRGFALLMSLSCSCNVVTCSMIGGGGLRRRPGSEAGLTQILGNYSTGR